MDISEYKDQVWEKAKEVKGYAPQLVRKDCCGAWILYNEYGDTDSDFGWEIDHVFPLSMGGGNDIDNLRAMQWQNNRSKGDNYPAYKTAVYAEGNKNVEAERQLKVNDALQDKLRRLYGDAL